MLDIKFIRESPDKIKQGCQKKQVDVDIDHLLDVDKKRREILQTIENIQAHLNEFPDYYTWLEKMGQEKYLDSNF